MRDYDIEMNWDLFDKECVNRKWGDERCMTCPNLYGCHEHPDDRLDTETSHFYTIYPFSQRESTIDENIEYTPFEINRHNRHLIGYGANYKTKDERYYDSCAEWEQIIPDTFEHDGVHYLITSIGEDGFYHCDELRVVSVPHSVKIIKSHAFNECFGLEAIYIGKGLCEIINRFIECDHLIKIKVHPDNPYFCDVDGVLYSKDMKVLIRYPAGKKGEEFTIPESVEEISNLAFYNCQHLRRINMSDNVRIIGDSAFRRSRKFEFIKLSKNLEYLGEYIILGCSEECELYYSGTIEDWDKIKKHEDAVNNWGKRVNIIYNN